MKKKIIVLIIIILAIIAVILGIVANKKDDNKKVELKTIQVNEVTRSVFYAPQYVAINNGFL